MSAYNKSPFPPRPTMLMQGQAGYSAGSFNDHNPTTKMYINASEESAGNVIKAYIQVWEGPIPTTSQFVTTQGLTNVPNVTNIAIASVSLDANGVGFITYADASAQGATAKAPDFGLALAPQVETSEALVAQAYAAFSIQAANVGNSSYGISWAYMFPSAPTSSVAIELQGAINDVDAEYTTIGSSQSAHTAATWYEIFAAVPSLVNFVRVKVTALSSTGSPTIIAKIINS